MGKYLYETHMHTSETSTCAKKSAAESIAHYKAEGYDGVVVTDHMHCGTFRRLGVVSQKQKAALFLKGYREAKKYEDDNFKVILGMEIRFLDADNDYLLYGFNEDFIRGDELSKIASLEAFRPTIEKNSLMIFQAHPFRAHMTRANPALLDGMEVYNGHGGHKSRNELAYAFAKEHSLRMLSGSDYHGEKLMEKGGVYFEKQIANPRELVQALRNNEYTLKCFTEK